MDIGKLVKRGWDLTWKRPEAFLIAGIITMLLGAASLGILLAPLAAGLQMMYVRAARGERVASGDVFRYLNKTIPLLLAAVVLVVAVSIGLVLLVVPGLILLAWWMHVLPLMADRDLGLGEAMRASRTACASQGLLLSVVFMLVVGFIGAVGGAAWGLGAIVTLPLSSGALAAAYADAKF